MRNWHIWGLAPLLVLAISLGMARAGQMEVSNLVLRPVFYKILVFASGKRSLVTSSKKYGIRTKRKPGELPTETSGFAIRLWSVENGKLEDFIEFSRRERPESIDVSPDGDLMTVAFWNLPEKGERYGHSSIACYSLNEKKWVWRKDWPSKFDGARKVKFSSDGLKVTVIGVKYIHVYDAWAGEELEVIGEPLKDYPIIGMSVRGSVLSPSGRYFVVWQEKPPPGHHILGRLIANQWVAVWDLQTRKQIARWGKPQYVNSCAVFTKDEKNILFGSGGHIRVWSVEKRDMILDWSVGATAIDYLQFSDDYRYFAIFGGGQKFQIIIFDYPEKKEIHRFSGFVVCMGRENPFPWLFSIAANSLHLRKATGCVSMTLKRGKRNGVSLPLLGQKINWM